MNIAIIQNVPINDHRMIYTDGIARELVKRGYDVDVIIQDSKQINQFSDVPYKITYLKGETYSMMGQLTFSYNLFNFLKIKNFDIIHAKNPFSSILPALISKSKAKLVYDIRGLWVDFGVHINKIPEIITPFLNYIDIFCIRKADKTITISNELKKILINRGVKEKNIEVIIGDGVDLDKIRKLIMKDIRDYLGIDGEIIGYVGSISRSRHSERIIEAFEFVLKETDNVKLVMIGPIKEDDLKYFKNLVNEKNLNNYVFFTGFISHDEVLQFMKSFDVAVSYHEGDLPFYNVAVPTKILEYLANGCSIVTTNQQMYKNILTHKINCYITEQNTYSFAQGIIHILKNKELSNKISKNALVTSEQYSIRNITNNIEKVYQIICND